MDQIVLQEVTIAISGKDGIVVQSEREHIVFQGQISVLVDGREIGKLALGR